MRILCILCLVLSSFGCLANEPTSVPLDQGIYSLLLDDVYTLWDSEKGVPALSEDSWDKSRKRARLAIVDSTEYVEFCRRCAYGDDLCVRAVGYAYAGCCFTVINDDPFVIVHEDEDEIAHIIHESVQHMSLWSITRDKPSVYVLDANRGHTYPFLDELEQYLVESYVMRSDSE